MEEGILFRGFGGVSYLGQIRAELKLKKKPPLEDKIPKSAFSFILHHFSWRQIQP